MFASLAFLLGAQQIVVPFGTPPQVERLPAPLKENGPLWASVCAGSEDWNKPAPPVRIAGSTYLVGTCGISSILIAGNAGHVLIDAGTEQSADAVADNIKALGFKLADIPLGRPATTEEIAEVIRWLACDAPDSATGAIIDANGASYVR